MSEALRRRMVEDQLVRAGISDRRVLDAMGRVPREAFVPDALAASAYADSPLSIGGGQTISQPAIVALMLEAARVAPGDRVLDVGTGSGYAAAMAADMGATVHSIERDPDLAEAARARLKALGYDVAVTIGDGTLGLAEAAPFDAILVAAAAPAIPDSLRRQLAIGGRLVIPVGRTRQRQELRRITRRSAMEFDDVLLELVAFVPLIGREGWPDASGGG
ncbi:protein-L-isoaspartate(D-aspartate) O-methyltransferase [Aurantimonas sp. A2-1-M11]|uniref:protein-L-isoaspartate(D-aspartate) O-methyltransferase n=1 Tax=Aurantimonas sp. A2-1-M11 TaxID=3113712 RepID=UPI002F9586B0